MRFTKMHGAGNDFVVLDGTLEDALTPERVAEVCDRRTGIGADGLLRVTPTADDGARMEYWNADGSVAEMCGNGLRCVAWFAHRRGWIGAVSTVETPRGPLPVEIVGDHRVRVGVGPVTVGERTAVAGVEATRVDVGNPHAVIQVADVAGADVDGIGRRLEAGVPGGINTGFMAASGDGITLRVHERGVGETLACGSGAVAAAAVALGGDGMVDVRLPGGTLTVEVANGRAWLTGPVAEVFTGETP